MSTFVLGLSRKGIRRLETNNLIISRETLNYALSQEEVFELIDRMLQNK